MKKYLAIALLFAVSFTSYAQDTVLTAGAKRLFKTNKSKLTNEEKNWLFKQLNLTISTADKRLFRSGEYDVTAQAYVTDINKDGIEEVFLVVQSTALYGDIGEGFSLYTRNSKKAFELQSELGNGMVMVLAGKKTGYPDIALGGPGFEFPIYSWDGKKYKLSTKKLKDADLQSGKVKYSDMAECNRQYVESLK